MREYDIMAAGHLCFDVIPTFPNTGLDKISDIICPGKLVHVESPVMSTGGPVSNTGIALKKMGNNVCFCASVGDDDFGRLTIQHLQKNGNADGIKISKGTGSSYTVVLAPPGIDRVFLHCPGTNDEFDVNDMDPTLIENCRHFHFGYPPLMRSMFENEGEKLVEIFKTAKDSGATTSCDMALPDPASDAGKAPWLTILKKLLPYVDIFLPSVEEALYMIDKDRFLKMKSEHNNAELIDFLTMQDYSEISEKLLSLGTKMVSLKSGHRGWYFRTKNKSEFSTMGAAKPSDEENWSQRELWIPAYCVDNLKSAAGSGDSSIAGFLTGFLKGLSIEESMQTAVSLGFQNVQTLDAVSGIGNWDETVNIIESKLPQIKVINITQEDNYNWDEKNRLYICSNDKANIR